MRRFPKRSSVRLLAWLVWVVVAPALAEAQSGDSMGQGEAAIAVRSDVTLSVKGTGGTSSERLAKLGQAVSDEMGEIRSCYRKLVSTAPEVMGKVRVKLRLDKAKKPEIEVLEQTDGSELLLKCVSQVLRRAKYGDVGRPASAFLTMTFDNSRARGQAEMVEAAAKRAKVDVRDTLSGDREATWSTEGEQITFRVRVDGEAPEGAAAYVMKWIRQHYAAFLDCRRRSEQGGLSPEGDINIQLSVDARGRAKVSYGEVTVAHRRARTCTEPLFRRLPFDKPSAPVSAQLRVHFAP